MYSESWADNAYIFIGGMPNPFLSVIFIIVTKFWSIFHEKDYKRMFILGQ